MWLTITLTTLPTGKGRDVPLEWLLWAEENMHRGVHGSVVLGILVENGLARPAIKRSHRPPTDFVFEEHLFKICNVSLLL